MMLPWMTCPVASFVQLSFQFWTMNSTMQWSLDCLVIRTIPRRYVYLLTPSLMFGVNWLPLGHQIHRDFLWVGFRWFKHGVITEIPPAVGVAWPTCLSEMRLKWDDETLPLPPLQGGNTIRQLLKIAKKAIPKEAWSRTPVVLKATAGLRMLPEEKAKALLKEVRTALALPSVWHKHHSSRHEAARETAEKPLLTCVAKKRRWVCPSGGHGCGSCGLCGVTIFVTENIESMLLFLSYIRPKFCCRGSALLF